ncbi:MULTISPECIES: class I SAM-dependent methyltransferase [Moorena]|uniref:Class I SAM-dependent methyltransferase n=1 Tax=Moorena producens (strain JHB) TaxID=1454205 RepID=A0A1D9G8T0_MOOP1|nr:MULTISPECIES: class I SAM-dependent methyltransferase [Moorena]AOY83800.1 class I SAM-dependent methyltransferase [Moorena producens JHB]NER87748.1 class I SAM-dependent methyltransferase [Moorena sp. SIO3A2]NES41589.1 class I SAM-dependent methyltransferase [Moorena sp. SIO2C4]
MPEIQPNEWLKWICSSQNFDQLRQNYDQWADQYDADVGGVWGPVPLAAAFMLAEYMDDKQGVILDVGAGTGLVGVALAELGFEQIIGIDISPAMLTKAAEKGVYSSLVCCSIGDERFRNLGRASGIIATGVFAESHAGPAELSTLQDSIEPEGILVFTVRQSFLPQLQEVFDQPEWTVIDSKVMPIYDDPMYLIAYKIGNTTKS